MIWQGTVLHLFTAADASAIMEEHDVVRAIAGVGLDGDRYAEERGTYSSKPHPGRQVTLFEIETLESIARDYQLTLAPAETRRNVITRGVPLNHLVGKHLRVGPVTLLGDRLSVPCQYLADLLGKPVFKPLLHRAGLGCCVVSGGDIRVGDLVVPESP